MNKIVISEDGLSLEVIIESSLIKSIRIKDQTMDEICPVGFQDIFLQFKQYLQGKRILFDVKVDTQQLTSFQQTVFECLIKIPSGTTLTYGELATRCATPRHSRAVAQALRHNPFPVYYPCHRVTGAHSPGGFSAPGGIQTKQRLLALEGVSLGL